MSINIWTDSMQHAALLGKPVLFTNGLSQRDIMPDGWYCYDLRGCLLYTSELMAGGPAEQHQREQEFQMGGM